MGARHIPYADDGRGSPREVAAELAEHGGPSTWSNGPGVRYPSHQHAYRKLLVCTEGGITFHTDDGEVVLGPGDQLEVDPHTDHSATVGPEGVTCVEVAVT